MSKLSDVAAKREAIQTDFFIYPIVLPRDNRKLSSAEFLLVKKICTEILQLVERRNGYIQTHAIDKKFALPDANWSCEPSEELPNEFVNLFLRLADAKKETIEHFRGFCHVFSGVSIYTVSYGTGATFANMQLFPSINEEIAQAINLRNRGLVHVWRNSIDGIPGRYILNPPLLLGECGHLVDGVVVNYDTIMYQERVSLIYRSGLARQINKVIEENGEIRICEIGGGYGALALWFKRTFPNCSYTVIDLPECLLFSGLYLGLNRPDVSSGVGLTPQRFGFRFVPNYMAENLDEPFDLIINTLSLSEMSLHQVEKYIDLMKRIWLKDGGLLFEQNQDNRHIKLLCAQEILAQHFPERIQVVPTGWPLKNGVPNIWSLHPIELPPDLLVNDE